MLTRRGELSAAARQGREPVVQLSGRREVPARFREPHPAREPGPRPGPLTCRQRDVAEPRARGDGARLMEFRLREGQGALMAPRRFAVAAQRFLQRAEGEEHIDLGAPVLESFRKRQGGFVPRPGLDPAARLFLPDARFPQGVHRGPGLAPLLALEGLDVGGVERAHVLFHLLGGLDGALAQLRGLDRPFADGQIRAVARPLRLLLGARGREDEAPQRQQHLQLGQEAQRLLHAQRRERVPHSPYSFILRVRVLRWMPRISAAAPICPFVWASTRAMWRASTSASVSSPRAPASGSSASAARTSSGRCSARIVGPVATITARSTTLRSSRTLPTHGWPRSSSTAWSEIVRICFL